jgi:hypothetical protein
MHRGNPLLETASARKKIENSGNFFINRSNSADYGRRGTGCGTGHFAMPTGVPASFVREKE